MDIVQPILLSTAKTFNRSLIVSIIFLTKTAISFKTPASEISRGQNQVVNYMEVHKSINIEKVKPLKKVIYALVNIRKVEILNLFHSLDHVKLKSWYYNTNMKNM